MALLAFAVVIIAPLSFIMVVSSDGCGSQVGADSWSICSATGQQRAFWIPLAAAGVGSLGGLIDLVVRKGRSGVLVAWLLTASGLITGLLIASRR